MDTISTVEIFWIAVVVLAEISKLSYDRFEKIGRLESIFCFLRLSAKSWSNLSSASSLSKSKDSYSGCLYLRTLIDIGIKNKNAQDIYKTP